MRPLSEAPASVWQTKKLVLLDIDDTLTTDGRLSPESYAALSALSDSGLLVIPVTGRPAGWCDMIARFWPVHAVVGENGAFAFRYDHRERRMQRRYSASPEERQMNRAKLDKLAERILKEVPGAAIASDQAYREADLAIDFCEDVPALTSMAIDKIVALFEGAGAVAKVSSIHVNGWFGRHDKLTTTLSLLADAFGIEPRTAVSEAVFVGDSPNDAPMFGYFEDAVGVANIAALAHRCPALPRWVTDNKSGAGFVELADTILSARS